MSFTEHFRELVVPRMRNLVIAEAVCIARGVETWSGAHDAVMRYARRYGATYLPPKDLEQLDYWTSIHLLAEIDRAERQGGG